MGRGLQPLVTVKSSRVKKRALDTPDERTINIEEGDEYSGSRFGDFHTYMRHKKAKLQNQDAVLRSKVTPDTPQIFKGMILYINGYTKPPQADLWNLIVVHGGVYKQFLDGKTVVTHIIASALTPKKRIEFAKYRVVKPEWIVDCVKAGKPLSWTKYRVVAEAAGQRRIAFNKDGDLETQRTSVSTSYKAPPQLQKSESTKSGSSTGKKRRVVPLQLNDYFGKRTGTQTSTVSDRVEGSGVTQPPKASETVSSATMSSRRQSVNNGTEPEPTAVPATTAVADVEDDVLPSSVDQILATPSQSQEEIPASSNEPVLDVFDRAEYVPSHETFGDVHTMTLKELVPSKTTEAPVQLSEALTFSENSFPLQANDPQSDHSIDDSFLDDIGLHGDSESLELVSERVYREAVNQDLSETHTDIIGRHEPLVWPPTNRPASATPRNEPLVWPPTDRPASEPSREGSQTPAKEETDLNEPTVTSEAATDVPDVPVMGDTYPKDEGVYRPKTAHAVNAGPIRDATDPGFFDQYYGKSRLHHLSTWKAELKLQMQELAASNPPTPAPMTRKGDRTILHVDFDSFFAAASSLSLPPEERAKPIVVSHGGTSMGEIASCNYPAREFGIRNGMWMAKARELCPHVRCIGYDFSKYEEISRKFYDVLLGAGCEKLQAVSVDEALLDATSLVQCTGKDEGSAADELATVIRSQVRQLTGCEVSVGIGSNVLLARLALRKAKPAGQYRLHKTDVLDFIADLEVRDLPGVGRSIEDKLRNQLGIITVADLRSHAKTALQNLFGQKNGQRLFNFARGIDDTPVGEKSERKSVSAEVNYMIRFKTREDVDTFLHGLAGELSKRLKKINVRGKQLTLKVMRRAAHAPIETPKPGGHGECDTFNKSTSFGVATDDQDALSVEAKSLLWSLKLVIEDLRGIALMLTKLEESGDGKGQKKLNWGAPPVAGDPQQVPKDASESYSLLQCEAPSRSSTSKYRPASSQWDLPSQVDPQVLSNLPDDIRLEIEKQADLKVTEAADPFTVPALPKTPAAKTPKTDLRRSIIRNFIMNNGGQSPAHRHPGSPAPNSSPAFSQYELPSQMDPNVLKELPEDLLAKIERQKEWINAPKIGDMGPPALKVSPRTPAAVGKSRLLKDGSSPMLPSPLKTPYTGPSTSPASNLSSPMSQYDIPSQLNSGVLAELPSEWRSRIEQQYRTKIAQKERDARPIMENPSPSQWDPEVVKQIGTQNLKELGLLKDERRHVSFLQAPRTPTKNRTLGKKNSMSPRKSPRKSPSKARQSNTLEMTLTQNHFLKAQREQLKTTTLGTQSTPPANIDKEWWDALGPDVQKDILTEERIQRDKTRLRREAEDRIRKRMEGRPKVEQYLVDLPADEMKVKLGGVANVDDVRRMLSEWVETEWEQGPVDEDAEVIMAYVRKLVVEGMNAAKAQGMMKWLAYAVENAARRRAEERKQFIHAAEYNSCEDPEGAEFAWSMVIRKILDECNEALAERGIGALNLFE
ncbi:deoxycytidyl transferase [Saitoella coloradoensis]